MSWRTKPEQVEALATELMLASAGEHQRIGQMIVNACGGDPFYIENEDLILKLRAFRQEKRT